MKERRIPKCISLSIAIIEQIEQAMQDHGMRMYEVVEAGLTLDPSISLTEQIGNRLVVEKEEKARLWKESQDKKRAVAWEQELSKARTYLINLIYTPSDRVAFILNNQGYLTTSDLVSFGWLEHCTSEALEAIIETPEFNDKIIVDVPIILKGESS